MIRIDRTSQHVKASLFHSYRYVSDYGRFGVTPVEFLQSTGLGVLAAESTETLNVANPKNPGGYHLRRALCSCPAGGALRTRSSSDGGVSWLFWRHQCRRTSEGTPPRAGRVRRRSGRRSGGRTEPRRVVGSTLTNLKGVLLEGGARSSGFSKNAHWGGYRLSSRFSIGSSTRFFDCFRRRGQKCAVPPTQVPCARPEAFF